MKLLKCFINECPSVRTRTCSFRSASAYLYMLAIMNKPRLGRHCVIYGVESWNGVVEWSGVEFGVEWSGVDFEFGVESPLKQNNSQFCMGLVL